MKTLKGASNPLQKELHSSSPRQLHASDDLADIPSVRRSDPEGPTYSQDFSAVEPFSENWSKG